MKIVMVHDFFIHLLVAEFAVKFLIKPYCPFQYIKMRTQKISVLLKKRFTAPNWVKVSTVVSFLM